MTLQNFPPVNILPGILRQQKSAPQIWILTGERQTGKSSWCAAMVSKLKANRLSVAGIISHASIEDHNKTGIILEHLLNGETKRLASRECSGSFTRPVGCWYFDPDVLAWGNKCLQQAAGSEVVIFDECGPLELIECQGLVNGLQLFDQTQFRLGIVVIRPGLLEQARQRWPQAKVFQPHEELA